MAVQEENDSTGGQGRSTGVVRSWLSHHEEPPRGGVIVPRPEKREALMSARSNWFKRLGGAEALYGTIALLTMVGK